MECPAEDAAGTTGEDLSALAPEGGERVHIAARTGRE